jgi:steroid delta-isomerase-like uncharacterized protein
MSQKLTAEALSQRMSTVREHIRLENAHDLAALMETFGAAASYDDEPWDEHHIGREAVKSFYEELLRVLPDMHIDVRKEHAAGDAVIVECVIRGTHEGTWRGLRPTGRHLEFPVCGVYTFGDDDKLAGEKIYYDRGTILRQLGVFREPTTLSGQFLLLLNHPIAILSTWLRRP